MQKTAIRFDGRARPRGLTLVIALVGLALALAALLPALAAAAPPAPLIQFPGDGAAGTGAGRMEFPRTLAASPVSGHLYVADSQNDRINEFTAWGAFVRAFGWGVRSGDTAASGLDACTTESGCQAGFAGGEEPGRFGTFGYGNAIAIDSSGDVYVNDTNANHRVLKFSPTGEFLLMFGGGVNHTTGADVCTKEDIEVDGDTCGAGVKGTGDSEFSDESGDHLTVGPDDTVYFGDRERIQMFDTDGTYKGQITFKSLHEELPSFPEDSYALVLEADPQSGDLYLVVGPSLFSGAIDKRVFRINPTTGKLVGTPLGAPGLGRPTALATDSAGDVYVVNDGLSTKGSILKFNASGSRLIPDAAEEEAFEKEEEALSKLEPVEHLERFGEPPPNKGTQLWGIATNAACESESDDLYATYLHFTGTPDAVDDLAYVKAFGPVPQNALKCPPPPAEPPEISAQYATSVVTDAATLRAEINPGYDVTTTYRVQYGTGKCSEGGCSEEKPLAPGSKLTAKIAKTALKSNAVFLSGLAPGTTYHYRFVAENGAGTVRGVGGQVGSDGEEASFTIFPVPGRPKEDCPANQVFRVGASAHLSDCRAYELVSPAQRSPRGDLVSGVNVADYPAELDQSAADGESLTYTSGLAFGNVASAPPTSQYIASRQAGKGWSTHGISPLRESTPIIDNASLKVEIEEKAFTADLCRGWLVHNAEPLLAENAIANFVSLYRRDNCGAEAGGYEAISSVEPTAITQRVSYIPELQGFSADGSRSVFRAQAKLTEDAPSLIGFQEQQVYEASEGTLHFVCRLPDSTPYNGSCTVGTEGSGLGSDVMARTNSVLGAVSTDAKRVYWSAEKSGEAKLYLRENSDQEQSVMAEGECAEGDKACTYKVSSKNAQFWAAASDGSAALYTELIDGGGRKLREFDAATKESTTIADEVVGVAGASEDLSRFYFVSTKAIGGEGQQGEPNLYRSDEGALNLVATLSKEDLTAISPTIALSPISTSLVIHAARTTADGRHLVFASTGRLGAYDNRDAQTGEPDAEVYLYDAGAVGPVCVSCNPSGARPAGRVVHGSNESLRGAAALLPSGENQFYAPRAVTDDGNRVFFNSFDALVARDTNGRADVYEWERAGSAGGCEELGAELYVESSGGCLSLISSGESAKDSTFVDISIANGARDVFFKTDSSLIPEDPGLIDIYDAREGGGLPEVPPTPPICEGEACQSPAVAPDDPTPASAAFEGAGNVDEPAARKCSKGKVRRKGRCASKRRKHAHSRTNHNRRAAK